MILIGLLIYCVIGAFSAGMVAALHYEISKDALALVLVMMVVFAPITLLYLVGFLSMKLGAKFVNAFKG